jgi:hypothetical protein
MEADSKKMKLDMLKKLKDSMKKVSYKKLGIKQQPGASLKSMTDGSGVSSVNPSYPGFKDPFKKK